MSQIAIHHVQLAFAPAQREAVRRFYTGLLGLVEVPTRTQRQLRFAAGPQCIDLVAQAGAQGALSVQHLALSVRPFEPLRERLLQAQVALVETPSATGVRRLYVKDPAGNQLELLEPLAATAVPAGGLPQHDTADHD